MAAPSEKKPVLDGVKNLKVFLYDAFVLPVKSPQRAYIYLTALLFSFGFAFLDIFLLLDLAGMDMVSLLAFLLCKYAGLLTLVVGTLYLISLRGGKAVYPFVIGSMLFCLVYMVLRIDALTPLEIGILYAFLTSPFWGLFHVIFAISASKENLGNEVSLAGTGMTVGMTLGILAGGFANAYSDSPYMILTGFFCAFAATMLLILYTYKMGVRALLKEGGVLDETLPEAFRRCRYRSLGSVFEGFFNLACGNLWIVFMSLSGITATLVGVWNALMVMSKIIFTPFAGSLVNHGLRREMLLGSGLSALGWVPLIATNAFINPSIYIWSVGTQLYGTGLSSAWYGSRTVASLMVREIILGLARLTTILVLVPVLYFNTQLFAVCGAVMSVLMILYALHWMRSIKIRGQVMPIENKVIN